MPNEVELLVTVTGRDQTSDTLKGVSKNAGTTGDSIKKAAVVGGAALAGLGAVALKFAGDFDKAFDTIAVGTGATGAELNELNDSFKNVFKSVPVDMQAAATAIADLNTRTGLTGKALEDLATQVLNMTRLTGEDLGGAIESTTRVFGDWGITTDQQAIALDKLFKASQLTGPSVQRLGDMVVAYGAPLRQFGFSFEEAAALMGKFEKEGVNTELVMGSLRIAIGKFAKENIPLREGLDQTIARITELGPSAQATALAMEVFGARAGADMAAAILEGKFAIADLVAQIENAEGAITTTAGETDDWRQKLKLLKNEALLVAQPFLDLGGRVAVLSGALLSAGGSVALMAGNMPALISMLKAARLASAGWLAVLGPLALALGAAYVAAELMPQKIPEWQKAVDDAADSTEKLTLLQEALAGATHSLEKDVIRSQIGALEDLQEAEYHAGVDAAVLAQRQLEVIDSANGLNHMIGTATITIDDHRLSVEELDDRYKDLKESSSQALDAVRRWEDVPTQEVELLNIAISESERQTRALEIAQREGQPVTDDMIQASKDHTAALEDEKTKLEDATGAIIDKGLKSAITAGEIDLITEAEKQLQIWSQLAAEGVTIQEDALVDLLNTLSITIPAVYALAEAWSAVNPIASADLQSQAEAFGANASGTDYWKGGLTWVGEEGKELVNLPRGSQIFSNPESMALAAGAGQSYQATSVNVQVYVTVMGSIHSDRDLDRYLVDSISQGRVRDAIRAAMQ